MKKLFLLTILLCLFSSVAFATIEQAKSNALFAAKSMENKGYELREFDEDGYSGILKKGESEYITTNLYMGTEYAIIVGASNSAKYMEIYVYDENWEEIVKNSGNGTSVLVEFAPKWSGTFYFKIIMTDCGASGANWIQAIGYKEKGKKK